MLDQKYWGLPIWVWLVVVGIVFFSSYQTVCSVESPTAKSENKENFSEAKNKSKIKVFNFNTSWCGWSRRFQPEWDKFSEKVKTDPNLSHVDALDVKCDDNNNELMCEKYEVPGYPFVVVEIDGKRTQYNGERTASALIKHILQ